MRAKSRSGQDDLRPEYTFDYSKAVRGKYYARLLREGANVVVLDPDVAKAFRTSDAVNEALRSLLRMNVGANTTPNIALERPAAHSACGRFAVALPTRPPLSAHVNGHGFRASAVYGHRKRRNRGRRRRLPARPIGVSLDPFV